MKREGREAPVQQKRMSGGLLEFHEVVSAMIEGPEDGRVRSAEI